MIRLLFIFAVLRIGRCCTLTSPETYTTTDASTLTSIAYITSFTLNDCPLPAGSNLYAQIDSKQIHQLAILSNNKFQLSWTEELAVATKGDRMVTLYTEEGLNGLKKGLNKALVEFKVNHPGAYSGPWLNSEHLAAILGVGVVYVAVGAKGKLLN